VVSVRVGDHQGLYLVADDRWLVSIPSVFSSFRSISARQLDSPVFVSTRHPDEPWIAADFAVLNEAAVDVTLDVDLHLLAAKRTRDQKLV